MGDSVFISFKAISTIPRNVTVDCVNEFAFLSLFLTLQQFRFLLTLLTLVRNSRVATTKDAVSISGEAQV